MPDDDLMLPHYPSPLITLYEMRDRDAFTGERRTASNLEDLVSSSGMPYHETPHSGEVRYAVTEYDPLGDAMPQSSIRHQSEVAYFCPIENLWIQGVPKAQDYDNIGPLSGSAGLILFCRTCGFEVGRDVMKRSCATRQQREEPDMGDPGHGSGSKIFGIDDPYPGYVDPIFESEVETRYEQLEEDTREDREKLGGISLPEYLKTHAPCGAPKSSPG